MEPNHIVLEWYEMVLTTPLSADSKSLMAGDKLQTARAQEETGGRGRAQGKRARKGKHGECAIARQRRYDHRRRRWTLRRTSRRPMRTRCSASEAMRPDAYVATADERKADRQRLQATMARQVTQLREDVKSKMRDNAAKTDRVDLLERPPQRGEEAKMPASLQMRLNNERLQGLKDLEEAKTKKLQKQEWQDAKEAPRKDLAAGPSASTGRPIARRGC